MTAFFILAAHHRTTAPPHYRTRRSVSFTVTATDELQSYILGLSEQGYCKHSLLIRWLGGAKMQAYPLRKPTTRLTRGGSFPTSRFAQRPPKKQIHRHTTANSLGARELSRYPVHTEGNCLTASQCSHRERQITKYKRDPMPMLIPLLIDDDRDCTD